MLSNLSLLTFLLEKRRSTTPLCFVAKSKLFGKRKPQMGLCVYIAVQV
jgi:hypothetical protein